MGLSSLAKSCCEVPTNKCGSRKTGWELLCIKEGPSNTFWAKVPQHRMAECKTRFLLHIMDVKLTSREGRLHPKFVLWKTRRDALSMRVFGCTIFWPGEQD